MSFADRAKSISYNDWHAARDFMAVLGAAVDRLEVSPVGQLPSVDSPKAELTKTATTENNDLKD